MNEPLQQATNTIANRQEIKARGKQKGSIQLPAIQQTLAASLLFIDFGDCVCGSVIQKKLGILMLSNQEVPRIICMRIVFEDQSLSELPQYIFGLRKQNAFQYFDEYKFKAMQKGVYNFIVGVKTPFLANYPVKGKLEITLEGAKNAITIMVSQTPRIPEIKCNRQLINEEGQRLIKIGVIKNKSKKQVKLAFRSTQNLSFTLLTELVGLENQGEGVVDVKPKSVQVGGKGTFILTFTNSCPTSLEDNTVCVRRILVLRVKDTKIHFHFPIEVMFYPGGERTQISIE